MTIPPHAIRVGGVVVWRDVSLRGTGFPARWLLELAAPTTARQIEAALDDDRRGVRALRDARPALEAAYADDWRRVGEHLRAAARTPLLREALLWRNRSAILNVVEPMLRRPAGTMDSSTRRYERMVATYLQRYCAKNDSLGFFGPTGWATLDDRVSAARIVPGRLLERRTVYFEHWAIDAIAGQLSEDRALRLAIAPRRMPTTRLAGDRLHHSIDRVARLPAAAVRLLEACDGVRSARAIAEALVAEPALELESVDEVYDLLDELAEARLVIWRLEVPTAGFAPEQALRDALAAAEPGPEIEAAQAAVASLEAARDRIAAAAGQLEPLAAALGALHDTFVGLTGGAESRLSGKTYASRSLVFEDCRRGGEVVLGQAFLARIAPALSWLQAANRWFTHTLASRFRAVFAELHRQLAAALDTPEVDFVRFYSALGPHLSGQVQAQSTTVREVRDELYRRWAEILPVPHGAHRVELRGAEVDARARAAFDAPAPGWPSARHTSADLMIAADGPDALARGEYLVVLSKVHAAVTAVSVPALAKEHDDPASLHRARQLDLGPLVAPVEPRGNFNRMTYYSLSEGNVDIEFGDARSGRPRDRVFAVADFVVCERDGQLRVRHRDGSIDLDLVRFLEADLLAESYVFDLFAPASHQPRVTVDGFVLGRERWQFDAAEMTFIRAAHAIDRFAGARRWALAHRLPRFVYVRTTSEPKPVYLDLDSAVFVEVFAKLVQTGDTVTVTEMLPAFDQLWLRDADGEAYCSELRVVAVDDLTADA